MAESMSGETVNTAQREQIRASTRRAVYFWHAWSALMVAPVLLVLLLTGSLYLFDREFDEAWQRQAYRVVPDGQPAASLAEQQNVLRALYPQASINKVLLPRHANQAVRWQLDATEGSRLFYLDPYQLTVNAIEDPARAPMALVRRLHGELLAGDVGGYLIEWMSCWTLFLLLTGAWIWWPRQWKVDGRWRLGGILWPRRRADGSLHWRDWHAIPALLASLMLAFLVLTGLPWSIFWGEQFATLTHKLSPTWSWIAPSPNFHVPASLQQIPSLDPHAEHQAQPAQAVGEQTMPKEATTEVPVTGAAEPWTSQHHQVPAVPATNQSELPAKAPANIAVLEPVLAQLPIAEFGPGVRVFYPKETAEGSTQPFKISYVPDQAQGQRTLYVDPHSGAVLDDIGWPRYSLAAKVIEWGVMVHLGRQFGLVNQLLNLLFCLVALFALLAGLRLWWQRRRSGRWLPQRGKTDRLPRGLQLSLGFLVLIFPLLLLSVLLSLFLSKTAASRSFTV
jgi:uncharacterized iron-regulated membrane protein